MSLQDEQVLDDQGPLPRDDVGPRDDDLGPDPAEVPEEEPTYEAPDPDDPAEILAPLVDEVTIIIGPDERDRTGTYVQRELMWFGKIELYGVLGRAVKIVMEGEGGLGLDDLLSMRKPKDMVDQLLARQPGADTAPDAADNPSNVVDAGQMLAAFARVISVAPDLLKELYCVILAAPKGHRPWLIDWGLDTMPDKMGMEILERFIDQNWAAVEGFFIEEMPRAARRAAQARQRSRGGR